MERDSSFSAETAGVLSGDDDALADVTVIVCASCRDETGSDGHPRAGEMLAEDTRRAASGENIRIR
ncbi:MAG: metal-binding protein, partial [Mesorhizobium sp.]